MIDRRVAGAGDSLVDDFSARNLHHTYRAAHARLGGGRPNPVARHQFSDCGDILVPEAGTSLGSLRLLACQAKTFSLGLGPLALFILFASLGNLGQPALLLLALALRLIAALAQLLKLAQTRLFGFAPLTLDLLLLLGQPGLFGLALQLALPLRFELSLTLFFGPLLFAFPHQRLLTLRFFPPRLFQSAFGGLGLRFGELLLSFGLEIRRGVDQCKTGRDLRRPLWFPAQAAQPQQGDAGQVHAQRHSKRAQRVPCRRFASGRFMRSLRFHCSGGSPMKPMDATPARCSSTMVS